MLGDYEVEFMAYYAVDRLKNLKKMVGLKSRQWSLSDFKKNTRQFLISKHKEKLNKHFRIAMILVSFGIFDFILVPRSTTISIFL